MAKPSSRFGKAALFLAGVLWLVTLAPLRAGDNGLTDEIEMMHTRYLAAFNHGNAAALAALFTEDGIFVDGAGKVAAGRAAIAAMFARGFGDASVTLAASADHIGALDDGAWDVGHGAQIIKSAAGTQRLLLHYTAIYTRQSGLLKLRVVSVGAE